MFQTTNQYIGLVGKMGQIDRKSCFSQPNKKGFPVEEVPQINPATINPSMEMYGR